ncbi:hypothetical protein HYFRA_00008675 [Hymenoscyphus fraxineus]|uniref:DNA-binding protein REB1 n=1 Tax=Hymenoscyphus fraxineus TaxID=746836 RepID=A0A9N9KW80_9HELO|nr:hypothetical protein HYFRA_00008675 [Hymenoscyphus fraxineus]
MAGFGSYLIPRVVKGLFSSSQAAPVEKDRIPDSSFTASSPSRIPLPVSKLNSPRNGATNGGGVDGEGDVDMHRGSGDEQVPEPESVKRKKKKRTSKGKEVEDMQMGTEEVVRVEPPPILPGHRVEPPPILPGHTSTGKKRMSQAGLGAVQEEPAVDGTPVKAPQSKERSKGKKRASKGGEEELVDGMTVAMDGHSQNSGMTNGALGLDGVGAEPEIDDTPTVKKPKRSKKKSLPVVGVEPEIQDAEDVVMDDAPATKKGKKPRKKSLLSTEVESEIREEEDVVMDDPPATKNVKQPKKKSSPVVEIGPPGEDEGPIDDQPAPRANGKTRAPKKSKGKVNIKDTGAPEPEGVEPAVEDIQVTSNSKKKKTKVTKVSVAIEEKNDQQPEPEDEEDLSTPKRPSAKALGKRKATESISQKVPKKRKGSAEQRRSSGVSLLDLGFTQERSSPVERPLFVDESVQSSKNLTDITSTDAAEEQEPPTEPKAAKSNSRRKSKAKTPIMPGSSRPSTATGKKDAPTYTTYTRAKKPVNPATHDAGHSDEEDAESDDSLAVVPQPTKSSPKKKRRLLVDDDDEPGPSSSKSKRSSQVPAKKTTKEENEKPQRKGKIADEDLQSIVGAVNLYRDMHDLNDYQMAEVIQQTEGELSDEHKSFWKEIREAVPKLPNRKVYETCRRRFHNFEARGSWTEEQDEDLKRAYEKYPQKWKLIGGIINRFPEDARDRWRNYLVCGDKLRKNVWDKEEEDKLRAVVAECIEVLKKAQGKGDRKKPLEYWEDRIEWSTVSAKMNLERSRLQCIAKWKQIKDRGDSEDEHLHEISHSEWREAEATRIAQDMGAAEVLRLLRLIRDSGAGKENNIPWVLIVEELGVAGKNRRMAYKVCLRKLRAKIPNGEDMKFREAVESLINVFEAVHPRYPEAYRDHEVIKEVKRRNRPSKKTIEDEETDADPTDQILQEAAGDNGEGSSKQKTAKNKAVEVPQKGGKSTSRDPPASDDEEPDTENQLPLGSQKPFRAPKSKNRRRKPSLDEDAAEQVEEEQPSESKKKSRKTKSKGKTALPPPDEEVAEPSVEADAEENETPAEPLPKKSRKAKSKAKVQSSQPGDEERALEADLEEEQQQPSKLKKNSRKSKPQAKVVSPPGDEEVPETNPEADLEQAQQAPPSKKKPQKSRSKSKAKVSALSEERVVDSDADEEPQPAPTSSVNKPRKSKSKPDVEPPRSDGEEKSEEISPKKRKSKKLRDRMEDQEEEDSEEAVEGYGFAGGMSDNMSDDDIDDVMEQLKSAAKLKKHKQKDADATRVKETAIHQQYLSVNDDEEVIDASQFSETEEQPEINGHVQQDVKMVEFDDEPQVNGHISEQASDAPIEEDTHRINGHTSEEDSDVPDEEEDGDVAQNSDDEPVVNGHQSADEFETAPQELVSPSISVHEEELLVNGHLGESEHELASPEVSDAEENPQENGMINGNTAEDYSDIDDDSNNFGYKASFEDSDTSDYDAGEQPRNATTNFENGHDPEKMDIDPPVLEAPNNRAQDLSIRLQASQAIPTGSPSPSASVVVKVEDFSDATSPSSPSDSDDHLDDLGDDLVEEQEAKISFLYPEASDEEDDQVKSDHEVEADEMDHDEAGESENEPEHLDNNRHQVEHEQMSQEFDEEPAQIEDIESDGELIYDGFADQQDDTAGDNAYDEFDEELDNGSIVEDQPLEESAVDAPMEDEIESDDEGRGAVTPEPVVSRTSLSPDLDTPTRPADDLTRSISPDLDTPVKGDGRTPREFRKRVKKINYDDAAALVEEAVESSEDDLVQPKRGKGSKSAVAESAYGHDYVNSFPSFHGFESLNRNHGRPVTPHERKRRESESSSDYSIPAEATPLHVRAEREWGDEEE